MTDTKREPLLSDDKFYAAEDFGAGEKEYVISRTDLRDIYESARAKDAELIQRLVDEVAAWMQPNLDERFRGEQWHQSKRILDAASAAGFKPSND